MASFGMLSNVHIPSSARRTPPSATVTASVRTSFMGSLSHGGLPRGEALEDRTKPGRRRGDFFRQHARLAHDRHEVRVAVPPRHEVQVYVFLDTRPGWRTKIHAHVDPLEPVGLT